MTEDDKNIGLVHKGPSLGMLALVTLVIFVLNVGAYQVMTDFTPHPVPTASPEIAQSYFLRFPIALKVSSFLQLGAAITIGIFTASIVSRLRFLRVSASGVDIALVGGVASSVFLALSGALTWVQSHPEVAGDLSSMRLIQLLEFSSGGVVHIAMLGIMLAGISIPSLLFGFMPRWLCWIGLITAVLSELVTLSLMFDTLFYLLPVARFGGLLWLVFAGFKIVKSNHITTT